MIQDLSLRFLIYALGFYFVAKFALEVVKAWAYIDSIRSTNKAVDNLKKILDRSGMQIDIIKPYDKDVN